MHLFIFFPDKLHEINVNDFLEVVNKTNFIGVHFARKLFFFCNVCMHACTKYVQLDQKHALRK